MSEATERDWLEGLREEDQHPEPEPYTIHICSRCRAQLNMDQYAEPTHPTPPCWTYAEGQQLLDGERIFDVVEIEVVPKEAPEDPRIAAAEYERNHPMDDPGEADHAALREFGP